MTRRRGPRPRARVAARGRDDTDKGAPSTSPHACADGRRSRSHAHVAARTHKDADDPDFRSAAMRTPLPQGLPVPPRLLPQRRRHPLPPAVDGAAVSSSHAAGATYLVGRPTPFSRRRHRAHEDSVAAVRSPCGSRRPGGPRTISGADPSPDRDAGLAAAAVGLRAAEAAGRGAGANTGTPEARAPRLLRPSRRGGAQPSISSSAAPLRRPAGTRGPITPRPTAQVVITVSMIILCTT